jgi:hypothetical protein
MAAIEFDARVSNGNIEIPAAHRSSLQGEVHVIVFPQASGGDAGKIDEWLRHPLRVPGFRPLTRDEAHERQ